MMHFLSLLISSFGIQEVAIKKMRSNKSKEFFAELKVLCKIHHINVVRIHLIATDVECEVKKIIELLSDQIDILGGAVRVCQWR